MRAETLTELMSSYQSYCSRILIVTHEYGDPFNEESVAAAMARALALRDERPEQPLEAHVEQAVHECVCACAIDIEDSLEHGRSGIHTSLVREVKARVERRLADEEAARGDAEVDEASKESFPASDSPAWISKRHRR
jgi:hypothetical protein